MVAFRSAIEIDPDFAEAHKHLGNALRQLGRLDEAERSLRRALAIRPAYAEAHNNLGLVLVKARRLAEAVGCYERALTLKPDYAEAHLNRALAWLAAGDFRQGWVEYEWRWRVWPGRETLAQHAHCRLSLRESSAAQHAGRETLAQNGFQELTCAQPRWDGGLLDGKTILLWAEPSLCDTLQFIRYARLVRGRGARVVVRAPRSLHALLSRTPQIDRLVADDDDLPHFDCHAPLASLPRLFATTLETVPADVPYLFPVERLVGEWSQRLAAASCGAGRSAGEDGEANTGAPAESGREGERESVGNSTSPPLPLAPSPTQYGASQLNSTDSVPARDRTRSFLIGLAWQDRSLSMAALLPLAEIPGVQLIGLEIGAGTEQIELADFEVFDLRSSVFDASGDNLGVDVAAIMANLDLVIASDNAIAHLAGGMAVPVWVLLAHAADWRWLVEGDASPWYPTMRLFRQTLPGDWNEVAGRVAASLSEVVARHAPGLAIERCPTAARWLVDRGVWHAERGELDDAVALFRRALRYQPDLPEAYNNLGNALRSQGHCDEAIAHLRRALALEPDYAEARHNLGLVFARLRRHADAIAEFDEAIRLRPDYTVAWTSLGLSQAELRRFEEAEASFRRALAIEPLSARILNNLGNVLSDQGRRQEAVGVLRRAIEIDPRSVDAHNNLGNALRELGERDEAIASFERALAIRPGFPEAHNNLGIAHAAKGGFDCAVACYREALRIWPEYPAAHNNLGIALGHQKKFAESIASYRRALELKPDYAEANNNLGIALSQEGDYDEAVACFRRAIELKPDYAEAYSNLGITLTELGQLDEALASYNTAVRLKEDYPDAYMNRALAFLVRGDFQRGWQEYEARWNCKDFNPRNFSQPRWNGDPLDGRRILLHAEQGFGDTFQFVRYARLVKEERGGRPILWCPRPLVPLMKLCPYLEGVTIEGDKLPEFDCHLPLLSLPHIFGTTLDNVPRYVPYLFASAELVEEWRDELSYINALKIGINWQGNPRYRGDRHRSIPLDEFAPLAKIRGVRLISLQKGLGSEQIDRVSRKLSVTQLGAHRDDAAGAFMDTAAILSNLDLVVSSDTSLVHLAGGLGVPIWVALPCAADWRWLLARDDSPWYPTMRLFRQPRPGHWGDVFQRISNEVRRLVDPPCNLLSTTAH